MEQVINGVAIGFLVWALYYTWVHFFMEIVKVDIVYAIFCLFICLGAGASIGWLAS
jgi:hypothetical protein